MRRLGSEYPHALAVRRSQCGLESGDPDSLAITHAAFSEPPGEGARVLVEKDHRVPTRAGHVLG